MLIHYLLVTNYWFRPESVNDEINKKKKKNIFILRWRFVGGRHFFFLRFVLSCLNKVRRTMCRTHRDLYNTKKWERISNFFGTFLSTTRTIDGELCQCDNCLVTKELKIDKSTRTSICFTIDFSLPAIKRNYSNIWRVEERFTRQMWNETDD